MTPINCIYLPPIRNFHTATNTDTYFILNKHYNHNNNNNNTSNTTNTDHNTTNTTTTQPTLHHQYLNHHLNSALPSPTTMTTPQTCNVITLVDSFKNSFSTEAAVDVLQRKFSATSSSSSNYTHSNLHVKLFAYPVADGGEGFVESFAIALGTTTTTHTIQGPLNTPLSNAVHLYDPTTSTLVLESAQGVGIQHVPPDALNPTKISSFGVGQQLGLALKACYQQQQTVKHVILGLGGTASCDCGLGFLQGLLSVKVDDQESCGSDNGDVGCYDVHGQKVPPYHVHLDEIAKIVLPQVVPVPHSVLHKNTNNSVENSNAINNNNNNLNILHLLFSGCDRITLASDVTNPLLGPQGAVRIFGPQKGLNTEEKLQHFDHGFATFSSLLLNTMHAPATVVDSPGTGAAGGIGFMLQMLQYYYMHHIRNDENTVVTTAATPTTPQHVATVTTAPGFDLLLQHTTIRKVLNEQQQQQETTSTTNSVILTGEGCFDEQSLAGKLISRVHNLSCEYGNIPIIVICGKTTFADMMLANDATLTPEQHRFRTTWPNVRCILNINDYHNYHKHKDGEEDADDDENDTLQQKLQNGLVNFGSAIDMLLDQIQQHIATTRNNIPSASSAPVIDFNLIIRGLLLQQQRLKK